MTVTKRIFSGILAIMMLISVICVFPLSASAATKSNGTRAQTITVTTKANWWIPGSESITITQTKGTCEVKTYNIFKRKSEVKTSKVYGEWDIVVKSTDGTHTAKYNFDGSKITIKLKPNKTYKITITWDSQANSINTIGKGNFVVYPQWKVSKTYKVSNYY